MKKAFWILGITGLVWIILDIWLANSGDGTISQAMKILGERCATFPAIIGLLIGHFFFNIPIVTFRKIRNIALIIFIGWFVWDLVHGIMGLPSAASSGFPAWLMCLIGIGVGRFLWPQERL